MGLGQSDTMTFKKKLPCELSDEEFRERAKELADVDEEIAHLEGEKKTAMEGFKNTIGGRVSRKLELRGIVQNNEEEREVECKWTKDYKGQELKLTRLDTVEQIDSRTMTQLELQGELDLDGNGNVYHTGEKAEGGDQSTCPGCDGSGTKSVPVENQVEGFDELEDQECDECNGTGETTAEPAVE